MMRSKKGFEIAANTMVTLILTIVVMGGGIYLLGKLNKTANDIQTQVDSDTQHQIERRLLSSPEKVLIPVSRKEAHINEPVQFAVGVRNVLQISQKFRVYISYVKAYRQGSEDVITEALINLMTNPIYTDEQGYINKNWKLYATVTQPIDLPNGDFTLEPNGVKVLPITIIPQSNMGEQKSTEKNAIYVFNVCVVNEATKLGLDNPGCDQASTGAVPDQTYDKKFNKIYVIVP